MIFALLFEFFEPSLTVAETVHQSGEKMRNCEANQPGESLRKLRLTPLATSDTERS
jgi:hypothetical protein